jgi:lambda repressor-like predicted transcriptional regulator
MITRDVERDPQLILGRTFAETFAAYLECSEEVQALIRDLVLSLKDPDVDEQDRRMAILSITEALFPPPPGPDGHYGVDLAEAEARATGEEPTILDAMDRQEAHFGARVQQLLDERSWTQGQLAEKIGVGQPAVSLLLSRASRPQRRTVEKIAGALGVEPAELWPGLEV